MDIRSAQRLAWGNKIAKGFNATDIPMEFCLLNGEVAEAFDAWRNGSRDVGEELADSAIYLLGLAETVGVDLQNEIAAKIEKNAARVYHRLPSGVPPAQSRPAYVSRLTRYMSANEPSMLAIVNV